MIASSQNFKKLVVAAYSQVVVFFTLNKFANG